MTHPEKWLLLMAGLILAGLGLFWVRPQWLQIPDKNLSGTAPITATRQGLAQPLATQEGSKETAQSGAIEESTPWGRSPFLTEAEAAKLVAGVQEGRRVKAIVVGAPKSVATIDGQAVVVGEKIGEEKVVEINQDSVVLEMDGVRRVLRVGEPSIPIEVREEKKR